MKELQQQNKKQELLNNFRGNLWKALDGKRDLKAIFLSDREILNILDGIGRKLLASQSLTYKIEDKIKGGVK